MAALVSGPNHDAQRLVRREELRKRLAALLIERGPTLQVGYALPAGRLLLIETSPNVGRSGLYRSRIG